MDNKLECLLQDYIKETKILINLLEEEKYDDISLNFQNRQEIINGITKLTYSKEEFKKTSEELKILEYEKKLGDLMREKKKNIVLNIENLNKSNTALKGYGKKFAVDPLFFNKEI